MLVTVLSNPNVPHCDEPLDAQFAALIEEVASRDDAVGEDLRKLLVTNVVMPNAMVVFYRERGDDELLKGSELTARRAVSLLKVVSENESVKQVAHEFARGLREDEGTFGGFAKKWGYGEAQRDEAIKGIASAIQGV
ncbi:hypothetical protein FGB62_139g231 [Gracilaria domingensis]|nr:hypothetical protein FGB62_139g231 [Gracilaria domingensis]